MIQKYEEPIPDTMPVPSPVQDSAEEAVQPGEHVRDARRERVENDPSCPERMGKETGLHDGDRSAQAPSGRTYDVNQNQDPFETDIGRVDHIAGEMEGGWVSNPVLTVPEDEEKQDSE